MDFLSIEPNSILLFRKISHELWKRAAKWPFIMQRRLADATLHSAHDIYLHLEIAGSTWNITSSVIDVSHITI